MVIAPPGVGDQHVPMAQTSLSDDEPPPLEAVEVSIFLARIIAVVYIFLSPGPTVMFQLYGMYILVVHVGYNIVLLLVRWSNEFMASL